MHLYAVCSTLPCANVAAAAAAEDALVTSLHDQIVHSAERLRTAGSTDRCSSQVVVVLAAVEDVVEMLD